MLGEFEKNAPNSTNGLPSLNNWTDKAVVVLEVLVLVYAQGQCWLLRSESSFRPIPGRWAGGEERYIEVSPIWHLGSHLVWSQGLRQFWRLLIVSYSALH